MTEKIRKQRSEIARETTRPQSKKNGANDRNRTDDLFITSELLYRLSYIGTFK